MRVVVTGGTGLIGHALVMNLAHDGHDVVVVSRNPRQEGPVPDHVSFAKWDAMTDAGWGEHVDGADAVVNLAGASIAGDGFLPARWTQERKNLILESRVNAGKAVTEAIKNAAKKPKILIQSSAVGYYGVHNDGKEITEESPAGSGFLADACKQWEASTAEVESMGVQRAVIRTGVVLSDKDGALPRQILPFKLFVGGPIGSGKQPYPWIHLDDVVGAIRFLIENGTGGVYNLTAPHPVTNAEFSKITGKVLNRPSIMPTPAFVFQLAFGEVATLLVDGQRVIPTHLLQKGYDFKFSDAETAMRDLYGA